MFAYDTTITLHGNHIQDVQYQMQSELSIVEDWCKHNAMLPNAEKTKAMYVSASSKTLNKLDLSNTQLIINNQSIQHTGCEELL